MAVVFVSHSSKDRQTASALVEVLRLALNLTSDEILFSGDIRTGLAPAEPIQERLRAQLRLAPVVLAVVSEQSFTSTYQLLEMGAAWGLQPPDRPGPLIVALTSGRLTSQLLSLIHI